MTYHLRQEGYAVLALGNAALAREVITENPLSLLVFDPLTHSKEELALCQEIRRNPLTRYLPILLLLTREREITRLEHMELGVTDYILKPLMWEELRACVRTLLRGYVPGKPHRQARHSTFVPPAPLAGHETLFAIDDLVIDLARRRVWRNDQEVPIKRPLLFDLLVYFVRHNGMALTRAQLLAQVWGYTSPDELMGDTHTVSVHIHWLRQLLEEDPEHPQLIQTVRGTGYRFVGAVLPLGCARTTSALHETSV